jgi:hypothetical protein
VQRLTLVQSQVQGLEVEVTLRDVLRRRGTGIGVSSSGLGGGQRTRSGQDCGSSGCESDDRLGQHFDKVFVVVWVEEWRRLMEVSKQRQEKSLYMILASTFRLGRSESYKNGKNGC